MKKIPYISASIDKIKTSFKNVFTDIYILIKKTITSIYTIITKGAGLGAQEFTFFIGLSFVFKGFYDVYPPAAWIVTGAVFLFTTLRKND